MKLRFLQWFLLIFSIAFLLVLTILLFTEKDGDVIFKEGLKNYGEGNLKVSQTSQSKERAISQSTYVQRKSDYLPSQAHLNENQDALHQEELSRMREEYERDTNAAYLWGTYKPHLLHVITQRSPKPLTLGFIYVATNEGTKLYHSYKTTNSQRFAEYLYHNGKSFSQSVFDDQFSSFKVNNYLYKEKMSIGRQKWHSLTVRDQNATDDSKQGKASVMYYFIIENFDGSQDDRFLEYDGEQGVINVRAPGEEALESYKIVVYDSSKKAMNFSDVAKYVFVDNTTAKDDTWQVQDILDRNMVLAGQYPFRTLTNNSDSQTESTNLIGVQFLFDPNEFFAVDIVYDTWSEFEENEDNYTTIEGIIKYPEAVFLPEYKKIFSKPVPADHQECATSALSNLISGIGYYYGNVKIKNENSEQPNLPLYTACPSKTTFPRGFLWDEGFHGLVYCKWNMEICLDVLKHWMNTEIDGWIPREQLRGKECVNNGHPDYIAQIRNEANPPTLMFLVNALIESKERGHLPAGGAELLNTLYPKLKKWYDWFFATQVSGKYDAVFAWKSNQADVGLVLGSGLDDYPRGLSGGGKKVLGHLDLQVWMIFMSDNMEKIARIAGKKEDIGTLRSMRVRLREQLKLFYDPAEKIHKDLVEDLNGNRRFSPHFGYVNLFPLFFGFIQKDSEELDVLLNYISSPQKLWSKFGLLSLSRDDSLYMKTHDSYWGGPIWINLNYLTLRGLKLYYYSNPKARKIYEELRENVINTVKEQKEEYGYFFEQYNQDSGAGQKNHPFTGWTTTVLLMIYEQY